MEKLARLESSWDARQGRCAVFDGETTCPLPINHTYGLGLPRWHRFHDPSGSGRWIDRDDYGVEMARGGGGWPATGGLPRVTGGGIYDRPPSCGELGPELLTGGAAGEFASRRTPCVLPVGHAGMHRDVSGMEWTLADGSARMRPGRSVGRTLYLVGVGEPDDAGVLVGMVDTPELAAEVCRRWNGA